MSSNSLHIQDMQAAQANVRLKVGNIYQIKLIDVQKF